MAENFDDIRLRSPFTTVDGSETLIINQGGSTKGGFLSVLLNWIRDNLTVAPNNIGSPATAYGRGLLSTESRDTLRTEAAPVTGTDVEFANPANNSIRSISPSLLATAVVTHAQKTPQAITVSTTLTSSHLGRILVCDTSSAITLTLPTIAGIARGEIQIINLGTGIVTLTSGAGITFLSDTGTIANKAIARYKSVQVFFLGTNRWDIRDV